MKKNNMLYNKKVVIFDLDGTLIDSVGMWNEVDVRLIAQMGGPNVEPELVQQQRDETLRACSQAPNSYLAYCAVLKTMYGSSRPPEDILTLRYTIAHEYLIHTVDYKQDAEKFLRELKSRGLTMAIATTTKRTNIEIYRQQNKNLAAKAPLDDYFSLIVTREDVQEIKPHPEIYLKVLELLQVNPQECLVIEDSLVGVEAGKSAGMEVAVIYDACSEKEREQINTRSDYQFLSYGDMLKAVTRQHV